MQTNDSVYETTTQQSIDFDVNDLLNDADIGSSLELVKVIENTLKKINADMLCLLFIISQEDKIKAKVEVLHKRSQALKVSCKILNHNMNSFRTLYFLLLYDSELIIEWFVFTGFSATTH